MKRWPVALLMPVTGVLGVLAACAGGDDPAESPASPSPDGSPPQPSADGAADGASGHSDDAATPTCSSAGWCKTTLPEPGVRFFDIAPLEANAFAIGATPSGGVIVDEPVGAVLEFDGVSWGYLAPVILGPRAIWAAGHDDVWVGGVPGLAVHAPALHGTRVGTTWTWTEVLSGEGEIRSIWGSGPDDVYLVGRHQVHHITPAGTKSSAFDETNLELRAVLGTASDDVWVLGNRAGCLFVAHVGATGQPFTLLDAGRYATNDAGADVCGLHATSSELPIVPTGAFPAAHGAAVFSDVSASLVFPLQYPPEQTWSLQLAADGGVGFDSVARIDGFLGHYYEGAPARINGPVSAWAPTGAGADMYFAMGAAVYESHDFAAPYEADAGIVPSTVNTGAAITSRIHAVRGFSADDVWAVGDAHAFRKHAR